MTKILYSPGFGAGWSTWCYEGREQQEFMLRYQPLIDAIEAKQELGPVLGQFVADYEAKFGDEDTPYLGGVRDLTITEVNGPFRVDEYDGNESIVPLNIGNYYDFGE